MVTNDMLIRSASSLLWIIRDGRSEPGERSISAGRNQEVICLDRIASMFVTKSKVDASAVVAEARSDGARIYCVMEGPDEGVAPEGGRSTVDNLLAAGNLDEFNNASSRTWCV